jgi:hypothetical protein
MSPEGRARRASGLKEIVTSRDPGDWIDEQIADIRKKARGGAAEREPQGRNRQAEGEKSSACQLVVHVAT